MERNRSDLRGTSLTLGGDMAKKNHIFKRNRRFQEANDKHGCSEGECCFASRNIPISGVLASLPFRENFNTLPTTKETEP